MTAKTLRDALVGLLYLVVIAALVALSVLFYDHEFTSYVNVGLRTDSIGSSLQKGSDVKVRGVLVGSVKSISTDGDGALLHLQLTPSEVRSLPANMTAELLPKTLFGERYVALQFPSHASGTLRSGDVLHQDTSARAIELQRLFSDLLPVLQAVRPAQLAATLGELSAALRGRTVDLAATLTTVGNYLNKLAPNVPRLSADLQAFATTARTYQDAVPSLLSGLDSLRVTSQTILDQRQDYTGLLSSLTTASNRIGSFVGTNEQSIIDLSGTSLPSLRVLRRYSSEFPCLTRALVRYIPTADKAFGVGTDEPGAHVILHVVPAPQPYTSKPTSDTSDPGPRCPSVPDAQLSATAVAPAAARTPIADGSSVVVGIGLVNSPQENEVIAEMVAPSAHMTPRDYPKWASLLLGPALRGTQVSLK